MGHATGCLSSLLDLASLEELVATGFGDCIDGGGGCCWFADMDCGSLCCCCGDC